MARIEGWKFSWEKKPRYKGDSHSMAWQNTIDKNIWIVGEQRGDRFWNLMLSNTNSRDTQAIGLGYSTKKATMEAAAMIMRKYPRGENMWYHR
ncbi:MAG TPA: hypothetical protein VJ044_12970, partial [Candidatus Hodarchaeales archaeon]|nr:hypothetical protein [Candidatus Hodarchaeales archaeon]